MDGKAWPDFVAIGLGFTAGVVVFLFGVNLLADSLKAVAGGRMKRILAWCTCNRVAGVVAGTVATAVLDSSSAVAILVVGLVHAQALTFPQAVAVVMGANIGTTVSSQVYALDVVKYGPVLMVPGLLAHWLGRSDGRKAWGGVLLGLGFVFFALTHLEGVTKPLRDYEPFRAFMLRMENPLLGVLAGAAATAVLQSSSATMGVLIALVGQGAITMPAAVAMMLGAEVGTCLDVLVASAGRSREAVRVGVFQLIFNLATVALFVGLTGPLTSAAGWAAGDEPKRQLATGHVLVNVAGVLLFLPFTGLIARGVSRLVPDGENERAEAGRGAEAGATAEPVGV